MKKRILKGGAIEYIDTSDRVKVHKALKAKLKNVKKPADITDADMKKLVFILAKQADII